MSRMICILGSGGHSRAITTLLNHGGFSIHGIYDDSFQPHHHEEINGYPLKGATRDCEALPYDIVLAVGNNTMREKYYNNYQQKIFKQNLLHPKAYIEKNVTLGNSNQIFANAYLNTEACIENNNIINTGAIVEHEALIGSHNHISVAVVLCGRVKLGHHCFIGAGAVVIDNVSICDHVTVGANSVVIHDIKESGTYVGNPARKVGR